MMSDVPEVPVRPVVVLVAEDEELLRFLAVEALNENGLVVIEARDAAAALEIFKSRGDEINVLFTDVRMPGPINDLELAHRVRARWPRIAVIIVSGHLAAGIADLPEGARFLPKPYDIERIIDLIHEVGEG